MRAMLKFTAPAILLLISWSAHAQPTTGELFAQCEAYERPRLTRAEDTSSAKCLAYFSAVHQLAYLYLDGVKALNFVCLPNNGPDIARAYPGVHGPGQILRTVVTRQSSRLQTLLRGPFRAKTAAVKFAA